MVRFLLLVALSLGPLALDVAGAEESLVGPTLADESCALGHPSADPEQRGCCSWHGGVCGCSGIRVVCCDGALSPSCRCKGGGGPEPVAIQPEIILADVNVRGRLRRDGTHVEPHMRSMPDGSYKSNWSTYPNINPYTGQQ
jgi:hypothetical protein